MIDKSGETGFKVGQLVCPNDFFKANLPFEIKYAAFTKGRISNIFNYDPITYIIVDLEGERFTFFKEELEEVHPLIQLADSLNDE